MLKRVIFLTTGLLLGTSVALSAETTFGLLTQVEGGVFVARGERAAAEMVRVGHGIIKGDGMWVEVGGLARLTDTTGNRITIAGPAAVSFVAPGRIKIYRGSVKFHAQPGHAINFEHELAAGHVAGEAAVWIGKETVQALGLAGEVRIWHPQLPAGKIAVAPGYFTESSRVFRHLQPKQPVQADQNRFYLFLARFERSSEDAAPEYPVQQKRALASVNEPKSVERGSRVKADVVEPRNEEMLERLKARISGRDYDDPQSLPLSAAGPRRDAYGRVIRKASRGVASEKSGPGFEISVAGRSGSKVVSPRELEREDARKTLLKKLRRH